MEHTPDAGRRRIASFTDYSDAQAAVDYLSDKDFPVEHAVIIGEGVRLVEQVTGRRSWGAAALAGAVNGAVIGLILGLIFGAFLIVPPAWLELAMWGLLAGLILGILAGLIGHALDGGRRDFTSVGSLNAQRFDLLVDEPHADEGQRLLDEQPEEGMTQRSAS